MAHIACIHLPGVHTSPQPSLPAPSSTNRQVRSSSCLLQPAPPHPLCLLLPARWSRLSQVLNKLDVPYVAVLGNHDDEADLSRWGGHCTVISAP
jgi:hypothetical protein